MDLPVARPNPQVKRKKIARLRADKGLSIRQAAEAAGISKTHWGDVETDRRDPSPETLAAIAKVFDVPVSDLLHSGGNSK